MKFDRPIDDLLGARSKVALLRLLLRTRGDHTGRALARLAGLDAKTCHTALQDLARQGAVQYRRAGKAFLYRVNTEHVLVRDLLQPLFEREGSFLAMYGRELRSCFKGPIVSIILFGSVARGQGRPSSDVDLVVIVPAKTAVRPAEDAVDRAALDLASRFGSPPQVIVLDRESFRRKAASGDPFVSEVLRTGRVLEGKALAEVLKDVS